MDAINIFIHGNIGCGKTTLANNLAEYLRSNEIACVILREEFEEANELEKFYNSKSDIDREVSGVMKQIQFVDLFVDTNRRHYPQAKNTVYIHDRSIDDVTVFN